jgi:hypothetical protein
MANTVQSNLASGILDSFHVSIGLSLQSKLQNWQGRQDMQYESMKGLMNADFHSLLDFKFQMALYSSTNGILQIAWGLIQAMVPNNAKLLATLIRIPSFGNIPLGSSVLSLVGVSNIITAPQDILTSQSQFNDTISSVS